MRTFAAFLSRHRVGAGLVLVVVFAGALALWAAARNVTGAPVTGERLALPVAPHLAATTANQKVFRIDASRSEVRYEVNEQLAGTTHTATGTTKGIAGDILIDEADPARSQVGEIVVNVEQLTSDQSLRDARLRTDYLESTRFPLVSFTTTSITGVPKAIVDATPYHVTVAGTLKIKGTTHDATLDATVTRANGELAVRASTTVHLSDFGIGPISVAGFVNTGNEATLELDVVAVPADRSVPTDLAARAAPAPATGAAPSFATTVQPVLEQHCASCHATSSPGSPEWRLETAGDAAKYASALGLATSSRYMPPWPASDAGIAFQHNRELTAQQVKDIADWAAAGGPLDVGADTPIKAAPPEPSSVVRADVDMKLPEPYEGNADMADDYRCFVLDPAINKPTFVTGYQFVPDRTEIVHHATLSKVTAAGRPTVDRLDAADNGSGWACSLGGPVNASVPPAGGDAAPAPASGARTEFLMAWAPGQQPTVFPDDVGLHMEPGDFFTIQIHYHHHAGHQPPADQSHFTIQTTDRTDLDSIHVEQYLAPAEIPCSRNESGPLCDRDTVLAQLATSFGPGAALMPIGILAMCNAKAEDFASMTDGTASSSCSYDARSTGEVLMVMGHEHEIGKSFRITVNPGTPNERVLLDIPRWQFGWQMTYTPAERFALEPGDKIRVECSWDRSLRATSEPRYVTWNEGTGDEMCMGIVTTRVPRGSPP